METIADIAGHIISAAATQRCLTALKWQGQYPQDRRGGAPVRGYAGALKFPFHFIFTRHRILVFFS